MNPQIFLGFFILFIFHCPVINGISIDSVKEGPCIQPPVDPNFNVSWAVSRAEWFYPIWSKYEVYRWTTSVSGFDERVVSDELIDSSCQILSLSPSAGALHLGFAGTRITKFESSLVSPGIFDWIEVKQDGSRGSRGRSYVTLTDNKTFYVTVTCWSENVRSYVVQAVTKSLDEQTKKTIKEHLAALGFDVISKFYLMPYTHCVGLPPPSPALAPRPQVPAQLRTETHLPEYTDPGFSVFSPLRTIARFLGSKFEIFERIIRTIIEIFTTPIRLIMGFLGLGNRNGKSLFG